MGMCPEGGHKTLHPFKEKCRVCRRMGGDIKPIRAQGPSFIRIHVVILKVDVEGSVGQRERPQRCTSNFQYPF